MRTIEVKYGQSLFDIALRELGSVKSVFELAFANNMSPTDSPQAGQVLDIPENLIPTAPSNTGETNVRYIVDDAYLWYLKQFAPIGNGGTDINLDHVVKYTPQDSTETQQQAARGNLGIEDEPVPNWSEQFLNELSF